MSLFKKKIMPKEDEISSQSKPNDLAMAMSVRSKKKKMAKGGVVETSNDLMKDAPPAPVTAAPSAKFEAPMRRSSLPGATETAVRSMVEEIMAKRRMAEGGMVNEDLEQSRKSLPQDEGHPMDLEYDHMAEGGMVDIEENGEEMPNDYYKRNREALKENYDEGMRSAHQPEDSNEHGDSLEDHDEHERSMIEEIRRKVMAKRKG